jgi:transcriptional regulator with XRE-family HTH domain
MKLRKMKSRKMKPRKMKPRSTTAVDNVIGSLIKEERLRLDVSQEQLGLECGISFQQIQKYEKGVNRISAARLLHICEVLKVDPCKFLEKIIVNG